MNTILITGAIIVDPSQNLDAIRDLVIRDDFIVGIFTKEETKNKFKSFDNVIDASGLLVFPGFIDMHVHLREPGNENLETIHSGSRAAIAGGFTTIASMPDTDPPVDTDCRLYTIRSDARADGRQPMPWTSAMWSPFIDPDGGSRTALPGGSRDGAPTVLP